MTMQIRAGTKHLLFALLTLALAVGCGPSGGQTAAPPGQLEGTLAVSGAWALYPMMVRWGEEFQNLHPGVKFDISAGGAGKGMADALAGAADIGMVSRAVTSAEENAGAFWVAVVKDAVFPIVNDENPVWDDLNQKGITQQTYVDMLITGKVTTWGQVVGRPEVTDPIHVFTRSDACGAAETWALYLGGKQEDLLGIAVYGDPGLVDAITRDPLGIGFSNLNYAYDADTGTPVAGILVLPIDVDDDGQAGPDELYSTKAQAVQAVADGLYPSPPARDLNLVTDGEPSGLTQAFLVWVLTDGQAYVAEAGYVGLPQDTLNAELQQLQ
jgi:phosphate transport system substrate-binding protein